MKKLHWAVLSCRPNEISIGPYLLLSNRIAYGHLFNELEMCPKDTDAPAKCAMFL